MAAFADYMLGSAGGVMVAAARATGMARPEGLRRAGAAYGVVSVVHHAAALERAGRRLRPVAVGDAALLALAREWLVIEGRVPRTALAAALPAVMARRRLAGRAGVLGERLALLGAWMAGRV